MFIHVPVQIRLHSTTIASLFSTVHSTDYMLPFVRVNHLRDKHNSITALALEFTCMSTVYNKSVYQEANEMGAMRPLYAHTDGATCKYSTRAYQSKSM